MPGNALIAGIDGKLLGGSEIAGGITEMLLRISRYQTTRNYPMI